MCKLQNLSGILKKLTPLYSVKLTEVTLMESP